MSKDLFSKVFDAGKMLGIQTAQYQERILLEDTIPANESKLVRTNIASLGHFRSLWITGEFTTLYTGYDGEGENPKILDNGVCQLRGKLIDGSNGRNLFNDYIPLNIFLSPGRVRRVNIWWQNYDEDIAAFGSQDLFFPIEYDYVFQSNSEIQMDIKNDSNADNYVSMCFHGIRMKSGRAVSGIPRG